MKILKAQSDKGFEWKKFLSILGLVLTPVQKHSTDESKTTCSLALSHKAVCSLDQSVSDWVSYNRRPLVLSLCRCMSTLSGIWWTCQKQMMLLHNGVKIYLWPRCVLNKCFRDVFIWYYSYANLKYLQYEDKRKWNSNFETVAYFISLYA